MSAAQPRHRAARVAGAAPCRFAAPLLFSVLLSACVQTAPPPPTADAVPPKPAARPGVSPRGATVAVVALDGAPTEAARRFADAFGEAAEAREVVTAPSGSAKYFLRGYLTATPGADGVRLTYVSDLFDRRKQRAQRLTDEVLVPPRGAEPWDSATDTAIAALAAHGAQDLADVLTNTPEAIAAASAPAKQPATEGTTAVARQASPEPVAPRGLADAR